MPTTNDIRDALARNDADEAERLIPEVSVKHNGRGISGHDQQIFAAQITRIRATAPVVEPEPPTPAPEPPKRKASKPARQIKVSNETGDLEPA